MNTDKEFVPYQQSLDMKELGFDEPCLCYYDKHNYELLCTNVYGGNPLEVAIINDKTHIDCLAPLYQQAFSFLRNRYNLSFHISDYYSKENWKLYGRAYQIFINGKQEIIEKSSSSSVKLYFTYEEAEQACLVKLIEICKNK
jgi:hypothetical protein